MNWLKWFSLLVLHPIAAYWCDAISLVNPLYHFPCPLGMADVARFCNKQDTLSILCQTLRLLLIRVDLLIYKTGHA